MAKKASKQGKKASNKNNGQLPAEGSQQSAAVDKVEKAEKKDSTKVAAPAKETKAQQKPAKKTEKAAKEQPKGSKDSKGSKSAKGGKQAPKKPSIFSKAVSYFRNVRLEIKRTTWPSRAEVLRMSLIVVGVLIFFGVFIFVLDWVMNGVMPRFASLGDFFTPSWIDPPDIGTTE